MQNVDRRDGLYSGRRFPSRAADYEPAVPSEDPTPERLVQLSPYELDAFEMTVGKVRELVRDGRVRTPPALGDFASYDSAHGPCTYAGTDDASHDAYPINCVTWEQARAICGALGKRLPTEAEWEYAAGNLGAKTPFPWGASPDICHHAIIARGRIDLGTEALECLTAGPGQARMPGPVPGGDPLDVTQRGVHDMGGNVAEWTSDHFQPYTAPCWSSQVLLKDPVCLSGPAEQGTLRGGAWTLLPALASSYLRDGAPRTDAAVDVGLRCARSSQ